jgi:hypothetical protein
MFYFFIFIFLGFGHGVGKTLTLFLFFLCPWGGRATHMGVVPPHHTGQKSGSANFLFFFQLFFN